MGSIYYSTLRAEDLRQQIVQKIKQIQDGPQTKPSYLFSVVVDDIFVKMIVTTGKMYILYLEYIFNQRYASLTEHADIKFVIKNI